jgi:uncharacterized protein YecT (DUF1311 family)
MFQKTRIYTSRSFHSIISAVIVIELCSFFCVKNTHAQPHEFYQVSRSAAKILPQDKESTYGDESQSQMNTSDYPERMDSLLNIMYKTILADHESDTAFIRCFRASQRAWLKFRDAEIEAIMPPGPPEDQGSIAPLCYWEYKVSITKRRIEELMMWYNGMEEEGDACGTSYWTIGELRAIRQKNAIHPEKK